MINLTSQDWLTLQTVFQSPKGVLPYFNFEGTLVYHFKWLFDVVCVSLNLKI